jgi:hypothetical protein
MMSDPVSAITEAAATGEIAEIFADIRGVLGVAVVNLIWRRLATIPRALSWAWGTLRPLYVDGTLTAEAAALRRSRLALASAISARSPRGGGSSRPRHQRDPQCSRRV